MSVQRKGRVTSFLMALVAVGVVSFGPPGNSAAQSGVARCTIEIGGGGKTYTYAYDLRPGESHQWSSIQTSDFIRMTSGPCHFTIYNHAGFGSPFVILGSNLDDRIRAGYDGVRYKDDGGGETWRIRSLRMTRVSSTACQLSIGGGGVRMDYYGLAASVPAMDRIGGFFGGDCTAEIWNAADFGRDDPDKRFKTLHPSGALRSAYDPGFQVRSISITDAGGYCRDVATDQGRCLPQYLLSATIYAVSAANLDRDGDGLVDRLEDALAEAFRPIYVNDSRENATRTQVYRTASPAEEVMEPVTVFQVRPDGADRVAIVYMKLWRKDEGELACPSHEGDSQWNAIHLKTLPRSSSDAGRFWYVYRTEGGIEQDLEWEAGDGSIRGPAFARWPGEPGHAHLLIYFSRGKHHEYADGGWSGQNDKGCLLVTAHVDGRGAEHSPPYPRRLAVIRSPSGAGDSHGYTNVGSKGNPFFDDLAPYGFAGQRVWSGERFYSENAVPVNQRFE